MKKNTFFKRSLFGGFKREDVIDYIDNLKSELESAKKESEELREELSDLKSTNETLARETDKYRSESVSISMSLGEVTLEVNKLKAELSEAKNKSDRFEKENEILKAENEESKSKIARANEIESHIGGMIADAQIYKEKLISDAKNEINTMSATYRSSAEEITKKIDSFTNELNDISSSVSSSLSSIMDSLIKMSGEIERSKNAFADTKDTNQNLSSGVCGYSLENDNQSQHPQPIVGSESVQNTDSASFSGTNSSQSGAYGDFSSAFNDLLGFSGTIIS